MDNLLFRLLGLRSKVQSAGSHKKKKKNEGNNAQNRKGMRNAWQFCYANAPESIQIDSEWRALGWLALECRIRDIYLLRYNGRDLAIRLLTQKKDEIYTTIRLI